MLPSAPLLHSIARIRFHRSIGIATFALATLSMPADGAVDIPETISFNRDVRPFMSNTCFKCHGADTKANEADLRLDIAALAYQSKQRKNGDRITPISPGDPEASEAWLRINSLDLDEVMPPPDNIHQLTDRDKAIFKRWIEQGALYQSHWAYIPPVKAPTPQVSDPSKVQNPIDSFIIRELESKSIQPAIEAIRSTLARRLSLDLTGLPPTADQVENFLGDPSPGAYERLVDQLLESPHYGERMAVPWLDVVRFADTVGYHGDQGQNNFPYRDYVINAFNDNKPFDAFTIEQIAGDLLERPSKEQLTATGFNRLNMMTREGGAQPKEYLAKYSADRVRTVSTAWLGSTMGCTECHDHKYDPFSAKDFYSMAAFFADVKQYGVYSDYKYTPEEDLKGWNNNFPFPPEIEVESPYLAQLQSRLENDYETLNLEFSTELIANKAYQSSLNNWIQLVSAFLEKNPSGWSAGAHLEVATDMPNLDIEMLGDGSALFKESNRKADKDKKTITATLQPNAQTVSTLRIELIPDVEHGSLVYRGEQVRLEANISWMVLRNGMKEPEAIKIEDRYSNLTMESYFNGYMQVSLPADIKSSRHNADKRHEIVFFPKKPIQFNPGDKLIAKIESRSVGRFRISYSPFGLLAPDRDIVPSLIQALSADRPSHEQRTELASAFIESGQPDAEQYTNLRSLYKRIAECRDGRAFTAVTASTEPLVTRILGRGDWKDESGEIVSPAAPAFLSKENSASASPRQTRLDLAQWIVSRDNPLTARTFVNRLWAQFFGTGLSAILDDLGNQGEWPSHPELLDWLAVEFIDSEWDVKAMVRLIVTSSTYRQSSRIRPELNDIDPDNRLLARQTPRRLEAEFVRDNALFVSGLMEAEVGGPSARPYQPEGYYAPLNFPLRTYKSDTDQRQYRRGLYTHWQRTFLHPMLANFDAPGREECLAQRSVSNTPQQALTLLNDPSFVEAARVAAQQLLQEQSDQDFENRLQVFFTKALARSPSTREVESLSPFFADRLEHYRSNPEDAFAFTSIGLSKTPENLDRAELAAWTALTRVIFNLNESIVRY